jgi:hypothetical protein
VSFATITLCVASQRVFIFVYFVIDSVRKLLDTPHMCVCVCVCVFRMDVVLFAICYSTQLYFLSSRNYTSEGNCVNFPKSENKERAKIVFSTPSTILVPQISYPSVEERKSCTQIQSSAFPNISHIQKKILKRFRLRHDHN